MSNRRAQTQKSSKFAGTENKAYIEAMREIRRSNATVPERNKTKYNRNDQRRAMQRGDY